MPTRNPKCEDLALQLWIDAAEEDWASSLLWNSQVVAQDRMVKVAGPTITDRKLRRISTVHTSHTLSTRKLLHLNGNDAHGLRSDLYRQRQDSVHDNARRKAVVLVVVKYALLDCGVAGFYPAVIPLDRCCS